MFTFSDYIVLGIFTASGTVFCLFLFFSFFFNIFVITKLSLFNLFYDGKSLLLSSSWCFTWYRIAKLCCTGVTFYVLIHVLSRHFLFYFEILTSLSFQVSCPSSCVKCLIVFLDPKVFPPVPHGSSCAQIVCVSLVLRQCVVTCHVPHSSVPVPQKSTVLYPQACS